VVTVLIAIAALLAAPTEAFDLSTAPNTEVTYHDVAGRTVDEIRQSLDAGALIDPVDGYKADALTHTSIHWQLEEKPEGCLVRDLDFSATVQMPRLLQPELLKPRVLERWQAYISGLERHETGHVLLSFRRLSEIREALSSAPDCEAANKAGEAVLEKIREGDREYDAETWHGVTQGAVFP
jgi:predicted secreted Zn-dependent protease